MVDETVKSLITVPPAQLTPEHRGLEFGQTGKDLLAKIKSLFEKATLHPSVLNMDASSFEPFYEIGTAQIVLPISREELAEVTIEKPKKASLAPGFKLSLRNPNTVTSVADISGLSGKWRFLTIYVNPPSAEGDEGNYEIHLTDPDQPAGHNRIELANLDAGNPFNKTRAAEYGFDSLGSITASTEKIIDAYSAWLDTLPPEAQLSEIEGQSEISEAEVPVRVDNLLLDHASPAYIAPGQAVLTISEGGAKFPVARQFLPRCPSLFFLPTRNPITVLHLPIHNSDRYGSQEIIDTLVEDYGEADIPIQPINLVSCGSVTEFEPQIQYAAVFDHSTFYQTYQTHLESPYERVDRLRAEGKDRMADVLSRRIEGDRASYEAAETTRQANNARLVTDYLRLAGNSGKLLIYLQAPPHDPRSQEIVAAFTAQGRQTQTYLIDDKYQIEPSLHELLTTVKFSKPPFEDSSFCLDGTYVPVFPSETLLVVQPKTT